MIAAMKLGGVQESAWWWVNIDEHNACTLWFINVGTHRVGNKVSVYYTFLSTNSHTDLSKVNVQDIGSLDINN